MTELSTDGHPAPAGETAPTASGASTGVAVQRPSWARRLRSGPAGEPRWSRPALWVLLGATAVLYLWDLSKSGNANEFYAAAVKAGTQSWKAFLFGSLDSANAITVDKPPAALWLMVISCRIFGFSSFAMLLPQALLGVGTVALTWAAVRRCSGPGAGLVAGALVALTPVAALMFRFNNPDALLVFLMTLAGYLVTRSIGAAHARTALRWLLMAGVAIGFAFLTKMLQGLLVLPAFGVTYLVAAATPRWAVRVWHLVLAFAAVVVSAGWYVLLAALWPAGSRPYIGGSTNNSLWQLALGYNGVGRIFGGSGNTGSSSGLGGFTGGILSFGGKTGILRMFGASFGGEISWLLPAALIGLLAGLWATRSAPRTDQVRAGLILWGASLLVSALVFSFMSGTVHSYYAVALAPAVAAVIAIAGRRLWQDRTQLWARVVLALMIAGTGVWSFVLLDRLPSWQPWLRWVVLFGSVLGAAALIAAAASRRKLAVIGVIVGSLTAVAGTAAYTIATAGTAHAGGFAASGPGGAAASGLGAGLADLIGDRPAGDLSGGFPGGALPKGFPSGGFPGGEVPEGFPAGGFPGGELPEGFPAGGFGGGAAAALGGGAVTNTALTDLLNQTRTRWSAAALGSENAAGYILATHTAVLAVGGFLDDPYPSLAQFQRYVANGDITYFIAGPGGIGAATASPGAIGGGAGDNVSAQITAWVKANFKATTVGGTTVYKLIE